METSTVLNIALWVFTLTGYVIYNLYTKNVKQEEALQELGRVMEDIKIIIEESDRTIKEIDRIGAFKSDDEVGFFFKTVQSIQEMLNKYTGK